MLITELYFKFKIYLMKLQKYMGFVSYQGRYFHGSQIQAVKGCEVPSVQQSLKVLNWIK